MNMMKKWLAAALVLCTALVWCAAASAFDLYGTGLDSDGIVQQLGRAADYGSSYVAVTVPEENPVVSGVNPITGESWNGSYQPILVNIDAHPNALPHWGVSGADLIYETPIQRDGSTRQIALFMGHHTASAGPVRSARVVMCNLREMWGSVYLFYGVQGGRDTNNVGNWVRAYSSVGRMNYPYIDGLSNSPIYTRSSDEYHVAPHNVRADLPMVWNSYDNIAEPHPFKFTDTGLDHGADVDGIMISYKQTRPAYVSAYRYNESTGLYDRYRNGEPYIDGDNGKQCSFANVIVIRTEITWASGNPSRPVVRLDGQGVAEIFQNGKYIRGTWVRPSDGTNNLSARMVFLDDEGNELEMKVGRTFIQIVDYEQPVVVTASEWLAGSVEPTEQRMTIGSGRASHAPRATRTPRPTRTPKTTATPKPTDTPVPTATPMPTQAPAAEVEGAIRMDYVPSVVSEPSVTLGGTGASGSVTFMVNGVKNATAKAGANGSFVGTVTLKEGSNEIVVASGMDYASFSVEYRHTEATLWLMNAPADYSFSGNSFTVRGYTNPGARVYFDLDGKGTVNVVAKKDGFFTYTAKVTSSGTHTLNIRAHLSGYVDHEETLTLERQMTDSEQLNAFKREVSKTTYNMYCAWPEGYEGQKAVWRGRVMKAQEIDGAPCVVVCINNPATGLWNDPLWIRLESADQVNEGEILTFYAESLGTFANVDGAYVRNGYDTAVPVFKAVYIRK